MGELLERLIVEPIEVFWEKVLFFLPNLFSALSILIIGLVAGWVVKTVLARILRIFRLDELAEKWGAAQVLIKGGVSGSFSVVTARFAGWFTFFFFLIISLGSLNVPAVEGLFERFLLYLPNVFVALIIIVLGAIFSVFFGRTALIASVNAGLKVSGSIGNAVKLAIFLFSLSVAMEQLGIGRDTVTITFAIVFGGVVLALAIAFGLGGRGLAREYLEKSLLKEEDKDEISHL